MIEFKYPMWFKSVDSDMVVMFDGETSGKVVKESTVKDCSDNFYKNGKYNDCWIKHTDDSEWIDVTDQYKDKKEIPPIEMCGTPYSVEVKQNNKYKRKVPTLEIDVYDILKAFNVINPATQHAIKKLLCAGDRGYKDKVQDLKEASASISRAIELESDNVEA